MIMLLSMKPHTIMLLLMKPHTITLLLMKPHTSMLLGTTMLLNTTMLDMIMPAILMRRGITKKHAPWSWISHMI
jgi:hypothetical protein